MAVVAATLFRPKGTSRIGYSLALWDLRSRSSLEWSGYWGVLGVYFH